MGKKKGLKTAASTAQHDNSKKPQAAIKKSKQHKLPIDINKLRIMLSKQGPASEVSKLVTPAISKKNQPKKSLAEESRERLESAHFRYLNEQLYTTRSDQAWTLFQEDPQAFEVYHKGFQNQVAKWPVNPLDIIISDLQKKPKDWVVADFGCGEARLALSLSGHTVHSFDLVAANERVTACDMANVPLTVKSVDVVVFCLSLMGQNLQEFLKEANRVLKIGGFLYLAEVESRCANIEGFLKSIEKFGFRLKEHDAKSYRFFFFAKFVKTANISIKATFPRMHLKPCLYKKR